MKLRIATAFLAVLAFGVFSCSDSNDQATAKEPAQASPEMKTAAATEAGEINWYEDWSAGMEAAKKSGKPVYVHFTADWCVWCKRMEQDTYSNEDVKKRMANDWITIKIDTEDQSKSGNLYLDQDERMAYAFFKGDKPDNVETQTLSNAELVGFFGGSLPTLLFIDKNGKLIYPNKGYVPEEDFKPMLDYFHDREYENDVKLDDYIKSHS